MATIIVIWGLHGRFRVKDQNILEIVAQIFPFVGSEDAQRKTYQGPQVHNGVSATIMFTQFVNLGMAVVATRDTVVRPSGFDLIVFQFAVGQALFLEAGLEKTAAAAAAIVVGLVGRHVHKVFFSHNRFDDKA